jgi:hypothetical protein
MSLSTEHRHYEFNAQEDARFSQLAAAMTFVAVAMLVASAVAAVAALLLTRTTVLGSVMFAPPAIVIAIMAAQLLHAASHFRRIVSSRDHDVENMMAAVGQMTRAYRLQRWLWIVAAAIVLGALATTIVGQ